MRRSASLLVVTGLSMAGCVEPDLTSRFRPAWEAVDTSAEGWVRTKKALLCADCQVQNLYCKALPERNLSAEAMAATAIRPPQLDLFSPLVLEWILENDGPDCDVVFHLGDASNLATTGEFDRFVQAMSKAGRPWFMAPGNHDFFYFGVYDSTDPGLLADAAYMSGEPLLKGAFIRTYVATILGHDDAGCAALADALGVDRETPTEELAAQLPGSFEWKAKPGDSGLLHRICWKIDAEEHWRSYILQGVSMDDTTGSGWRHQTLLLDSCQYRRRPGMAPNAWSSYPVDRNCGLTGEMLPDQLRKVREWLEDREEREGAVFMCHHPFEALAPRTKTNLGWLWREYQVGALVTAHTHSGYFAHHDLGGARGQIELNLGSTTDWPMEWRTIQGLANPEERQVYIRTERSTLVDALQEEGGYFEPGWEIPLGAPDDYRRYKHGDAAAGLLVSYYLGYHLVPYWLPRPHFRANAQARDTEIQIKDTMLWTHARLIQTFPTDPDQVVEWPSGCSSDDEVVERIRVVAGDQWAIEAKIAFAVELAAFEDSRSSRDPETGEPTDEVRLRFKISQAAWASRFMQERGRRLRIEDEMIHVDWEAKFDRPEGAPSK